MFAKLAESCARRALEIIENFRGFDDDSSKNCKNFDSFGPFSDQAYRSPKLGSQVTENKPFLALLAFH